MNRREALLTMTASLVAFILPSPRKRIDLKTFCSREARPKYDMRLPYEFQEYTYATNGIVCVQVRPQLGDVVDHKGKVPPFDMLSWNHDRLQCWRPLPNLSPIVAADSDCPVCDGYGHTGNGPWQECEACQGVGNVWVGSNYHISYPKQCPKCKGSGHFPPTGSRPCPNCNGNAIGSFPAFVEIEGDYFNAAIYRKVQALDGEFCRDCWQGMGKFPLLKFRFDGGCGQMIGVETARAVQRIKEAKS